MLREFTDREGTRWRVYDVNPTVVSSELGVASEQRDRVTAFPSKAHADGWLCFESDQEKRRLTPIPPEWEICDPALLDTFCQRAGFVSRMTRPITETRPQR
ncbi:MAG TPA: hypothetical protein VJ867_10035 [Gemmatimonadaceae bacterium]|nr:hypothetical protein [Gemmatimonadaceae bacterium]